MFLHIFINKFKILLKKKSIIFWTLIFPLALGTFFNLAFSNLGEQEKFNVVKIAVVDNENFKEEKVFKSVIEDLSKNTDDQVFETEYVSLEKAKDLLDNNDISGYITVDDKINVTIKKNGLDQTIIKSVIDSYYQMSSVTNHIVEYNPEAIKNGILNELNKNYNYFKEVNTNNTDFTVVYFYTLIGMVCLYSGFFGINAVNETEANLSRRGARTSVAPTHKFKVLLASLLVALIIQYIEILILLAYLIFVLSVDFSNQIGYILLLTFIGSMAGISMGTLVGVSNKKSEDYKMGILGAITMTCSFLAGMMMLEMRYIIDKNVPIIGVINPVNMITDALYALYYYNTLDRYFFNIISLIIFTTIMITLSYLILRRKKYDSI